MRLTILIFISTSLALLIPRCDNGYGVSDNSTVGAASDALLVTMPRRLSMLAIWMLPLLLLPHTKPPNQNLNTPKGTRPLLPRLLRLHLWQPVP